MLEVRNPSCRPGQLWVAPTLSSAGERLAIHQRLLVNVRLEPLRLTVARVVEVVARDDVRSKREASIQLRNDLSVGADPARAR
jgi:hypothetical protein